jgi:hypothetical protein
MEERAMLLDELVAAGINASHMMPGTGCCSIVGNGQAHGTGGRARLCRCADAAAFLLQGC